MLHRTVLILCGGGGREGLIEIFIRAVLLWFLWLRNWMRLSERLVDGN